MRKNLSFLPRVLLAVVFALATHVSASTEKILHTFRNGNDGARPESSLVSDSVGNLYGTTFEGGVNNLGMVFMLTPTSSGTWKETSLHHFTGGRDGSAPTALAIDPSGTLYGIATQGGSPTRGTSKCQQQGCGTIFKLVPSATGWRFNLLHSFTGASDGASPNGLTLDAAGNLYVTTYLGGAASAGVVFGMTPTANGLRGQTIHVFNYTDGQYPTGGVVVDSAGNLFGTTTGGSTYTQGEVYELTPTASGWTESTVYAFMGNSDGSEPVGPLVSDAAGNFFGTMCDVRYINCAVFEVTPIAGGGWTESVIYSFTGGSDGSGAFTGVILSSTGNLYGTAYNGGNTGCQNGCGVVFQLTPVSGAWTQSVLYSFTGGADGSNPFGLILDSTGNLFGATGAGGKTTTVCGCGVVFELTATARRAEVESPSERY